MTSLISIDPGTAGTGLTLWQKGHIIESCSLYGLSKADWKHKHDLIIHKIHQKLRDYGEIWDYLAIELPFIALQGKSRVAAEKQDIVKLSILAGRIEQVSWDWVRDPTRWVPVSQWKGQLDKKLTERRIKQALPQLKDEKKSSHEWDSIGIGLFCQERF